MGRNSNSEEPLFLLVKNNEGKCGDHFTHGGTFSCSDDDLLEFYGLEYDDHSI